MKTELPAKEITAKTYDGRLLRGLAGFLKPYATQLALAVLLLMAISLLQLAGPYLVKVAVDSYILPGRPEGLSFIAALYIGILFLTFCLQYMQFYAIERCGQQIMYDIRTSLFAHLQKMSLSFFDHTPAGQVVTSVVNDVETLNETLTRAIVETVGDVLVLVTIATAMLFLDGRLAFITLTVLVPVLVATKLYGDRTRKVYTNIRDGLAKLNSCIHESVCGMSTVQVFNGQDENFGRFESINSSNRDEQMKSIVYYAVYYPVLELLWAVTIGTIIWYGAGQAMKGALQLGVLIAFIQYVPRFFQPVKDISANYHIMQSARASLERIFKLLDTPEDIPDPVHPLSPNKLEGEIEFRDVWFSYNSNSSALKGINFHLDPGESVAIVGATGAGKTSIINLIGRFYDIQRGCILIDGLDIRCMEKTFLRRHIGLVLQDVFLFAGDIERNIRLGDEQMPAHKVYEAAQYANANTFIEKLPDGYKQKLHERGSTLSLGQKQLVSFARVLAFNPKILILDEATSSLDTETEILVRDAVRKLIKGRTTIIIAHRLSTTKYADKIIVMDNGEIAEMGKHEELLESRGIYRELYELQFGR